jgi:hypothetical protein
MAARGVVVDDFEVDVLKETERSKLKSPPRPSSVEISRETLPSLSKTRSAATMTTPTSTTDFTSAEDLDENSFGDIYASQNADFSLEDFKQNVGKKDPVDAEDDASSIPSHQLEVEDLSRQELVDMVEKLYKNLKRADRALAREQTRRFAREKSLIKLARDLRRHRETLSSYLQHIDEVSRMRKRFLSITEHEILQQAHLFLLKTTAS